MRYWISVEISLIVCHSGGEQPSKSQLSPDFEREAAEISRRREDVHPVNRGLPQFASTHCSPRAASPHSRSRNSLRLAYEPEEFRYNWNPQGKLPIRVRVPQLPALTPKRSQTPNRRPEQKKANERKRLLNRYEQARRCFAQLKGDKYKPEQHDGKALLVLDTIEYGHVYDGTPTGSRYLVGRLHLVNQTDRPLALSKAGIVLDLDGQKIQQSEIPENLAGQSFPIGREQQRNFREIERPEEKTIEPGEFGWTWIFFHQLEIGSTLPESTLEIAISGQPHELDLKQQIVGQLGLELSRIGPEKSLALFEISGRTNLAALSILAEEFDKLVEDKVTRVVLSWKKNAQKIDSGLSQYLCRYANYSGRESNRSHDERYPVLTTGLQEVHLAKIPGSKYSYGGRQTAHDDPQTAVAAAIWTALEILPADDLLKEIREGHPLIRAAALSAGGSRLAPNHLSLVLEQLQNQDKPLMQKAAAYALRHFGDPRAVSELSTLATSKDEQLSALAVSSLSQSRYQAARDELKSLLGRVTGEDRKRLARELAKSPAPDWVDLYLENVHDPKSEIRVESLRALERLGHEQTVPLLKKCLQGDDKTLRTAAFALVLNRNEPELESLLEQLVLEKLAEEPLDGSLQNYLRRTKNAAAVPILVEKLKNLKDDLGQRQSLIQILTEIGDDRVAKLFVELYQDLSESEQSNVLKALSQMQSPQFLELAKAALQSEHTSLLYSAMSNLARTDSAEAEQILIDGFDTLDNKSYLDNLANILAQIGSPAAEAKLREGRNSDVPEKRRASINALRNLERQKPGYQFISQAQYQMRAKNWETALEYAEMSIATDKSYAPAHALKGTILLRLDKVDDAEKSFRQAIKHNPEEGEAVVGLSRVLLRNGEQPEAIAAHSKVTEAFKDDFDFEAHTALFFAELVAWGNKQDNPSAELQQQIKTWETEALQYLSDGFRHGYSDRQAIQNAPELEILKTHPNYSKAIQGSLPERKTEPEPDETETTLNTPRRTAPLRAPIARRILIRRALPPAAQKRVIEIKVAP